MQAEPERLVFVDERFQALRDKFVGWPLAVEAALGVEAH